MYCKTTLLYLGLLAGVVLGCPNVVAKSKKEHVQVGYQAPDFALQDENGVMQKLSDMQGVRMALYFYPKDQTPGCTKQACSIRDGFDDLQQAGIEVWGISYDSPKSHRAFKKKYNLSFPLLSDMHKSVAKAYGVKGWPFAKRVTFLIDELGEIVAILNDVDVAHHADEIIQAFQTK